MNKEEKDNWFITNDLEIKKIIKGMCAKNNFYQNWQDLYSNTYLYSIEHKCNDELELRTIVINYAKMQLKWNDTDFKKEVKNKRIIDSPIDDFKTEDCNEQFEKIEEEYDYQLQIAAITIYKESLTKIEDKVLFDIYFSGCNTRKKLAQRFIKQKIYVSESTTARMIKKIRDEIISIYLKNGGTLGYLPNKKTKDE